MPAIILHLSVKCSDEEKRFLAKALSEICAEKLGKPESHVLSMVYDDPTILFGGELAKSAFVEVTSIGGLNEEVNTALSKAVCDLLSEKVDIDPARVYLNFTDIARSNWGWNEKTF